MREGNWSASIHASPDILNGKPVIKGTRIPVSLILEKLAFGETVDQVLAAYPRLRREDIAAALSFASSYLADSSPDLARAIAGILSSDLQAPPEVAVCALLQAARQMDKTEQSCLDQNDHIAR